MAEIRFYNNCFEDSYITQEYDFSKSLIEQIENNVNKEEYKETLVECYDSETGKTFYAPLENDDCKSVSIIVNNVSVNENYKVKENDVINIIFLPLSEGSKFAMAGAAVGFILASVLIGIATNGMGLAVLGAGASGFLKAGLILGTGALMGAFAGYGASFLINKNHSSIGGKDTVSSPDVKGASNQSLLDSPYPFVIGKHSITPKIVADAYTEYSGENGKDAYIRTVYCIGYAPLKLTDFKLGDFYLAYNRVHSVNKNTDTFPKANLNTVINGILRGCSIDSNNNDVGDILNKWKNNDITLEILQHNPNNSDVNYGSIYPNKVVEQEINATPLFICDSSLADVAQVVYKSITCPNRFRTNGVYFTESCPKKFTINLDIPNGIYGSYTYSSDDKSEVKYEKIPLWFAIQYRLYHSSNSVSDSEGSDYKDWKNITIWNGVDYGEVYTQDKFLTDANAHRGNSLDTSGTVTGYTTTTVKPENLPTVLKGYNTSSSSFSATTAGSSHLLKWEKITLAKSSKNSDFEGYLTWGYIGSSKGARNAVYVQKRDTLLTLQNIPEGALLIDASFSNSEMSSSGLRDNIDFIPINLTVTLSNVINIDDIVPLPETLEDNTITKTVNVKYIGVRRTYKQTVATKKYKDSGFWIGKTLSNFQSLSGEKGINQIRLKSTVTLSKDECKKMLESSNSIKGIEVRIIRISANYIDQKNSVSSKESAHSYSDIVKLTSIVTETFDESKLRNDDVLEAEKIQSENDMKKFCYVAIKAKADLQENISSQLEEFNCVAESFSPIWQINSDDEDNHKWLPQNVHRISKYYGYYEDDKYTKPCNRKSSAYEKEVTKSEYEKARCQGYLWVEEKLGSNFTDLMKEIVFPKNNVCHSTKNGYGVDYLPIEAEKFNDATVASSFMLACVGGQNGRVAFGYENINLLSVADCWEAQQLVSDGSTFFDTSGSHSKGDKVEAKFEANGYVYQQQQLNQLLTSIATAGRCCFTLDEKGKIKLLMDKPADYVKGVISQQNCKEITSSYDYSSLPAGLRISFSDEKDGYETNGIYCWTDGNSIDNFKGQIEEYQIPFVTNDVQCWMLGRYILGSRILNREVLTAKIGMEGFSLSLGDVVSVASDELLIGGGSARVQEVLKTKDYIYGFVTDGTYEYTGKTETIDEEEKSVQGISILQPKKSGKNRVVTYRLATNNSSIQYNQTLYTLQKGVTNICLFDTPISVEENQFTTEDIVLFGLFERISAKYKITKIKPSTNGTFTLTLIQYNEQLYNYGKELPVFKNYMTIPAPIQEGMTFSEVPNSVKDKTESDNQISNSLEEKINKIYATIDTALYTLDVSPEAQSLFVDENGVIKEKWFYISAYMYYKDNLLDNVTYKACLESDDEVGTWEDNKVKISTTYLKGDILYLKIKALYYVDEVMQVAKETRVQVSKIYGTDGTKIYKMLFLDGEKVKVDKSGTIIEPSQLRVEKRLVTSSGENPTDYGRITLEVVPDGKEEDYKPYVQVTKDEVYSANTQYFKKVTPTVLKVGDNIILGNDDVGALFFEVKK